MSNQSVLVIDDDHPIQHLVSRGLESLNVNTLKATTADEGLLIIQKQQPDLVLLDILLPDMSGLECFRKIQSLDHRLPVIFITSSSSSETAIQAMQLGAYNYLVKPLDLPKLKMLVEQALRTRRMMSVPVSIPTSGSESEGDLLVGRSNKMVEVYSSIGRVAAQDVTVLIRGESGTGKELIARAIYQHSRRKDGPFLAVNCAALPDSLLESELFGHEKGSFTGADSRHIGKFEQCSGGTIFLDEVGDMAPLVQSKVLRLLQEQKFERVGGRETIQTDVRIITATNRDLEKMVQSGEYRADLYYRLNGFTIELPPLRQRGDDVRVLIEHFLAKFRKEMNKTRIEGIAPEALEMLIQYPWPGNVRELQSVIKQTLLNASGTVIAPEFLPAEIRTDSKPLGEDRHQPATPAPATPAQPQPVAQPAADETPSCNLEPFITQRLKEDSENLYAETLERMESYLISRVLSVTGGNQSQASRILGITRGSLRTKIRALNISIEQVVSVDTDHEE